MILKIVLGKGARGLLNYVSRLSKSAHHPQPVKKGEPKQHAPPIFSTFAGTTPREIAAEFAALRLLKPNLTKAVGHLMLSPGPTDRLLSKAEWQKALNIALDAHGAADAPHAAYPHYDTDDPHMHVFFSRILPDGRVISDSQNYQKNRNAARQIEQELNMEKFNSTPKLDAPGDRQAAYNAAKRDERLGLKALKALDQGEIRAALKEARDLAEFEAKLKELGIEAEFARRGQTQEVFGWKLRRAGDPYWSKASTLAKDLSWPSIKHRFAEAPALKQATYDSIQSLQAKRPDVAKHPQALAKRNEKEDDDEKAQTGFLMAAPQSNADRQRRQQEHEQRLLAIQKRVDSSNFAKAMGRLGASISHFAIELIAKIIDWLKQLLSRFGLGARQQIVQGAGGQRLVSLQPEVIEVEAKLIEPMPDPLMLDYRLSQGAAAVEQINKAIEEKNFENLPGTGSPGREELVSELQKTVEDDAAAGFAVAASEQLAQLQACFVAHKDLSEEMLAKSWTSTDHPLSKQIDQAEATMLRLQTADAEWSKRHPWQVKLGADAPNFDVINQAKKKRTNLQAQLKAEVERQQATTAPAIAALKMKTQQAFASLAESHIKFERGAARAKNFEKDERFSTASSQIDEQAQKVHSKVSAYMSHFQLHIDPAQRVSVLAEIKVAQALLDKWALIAETPVPKPNSKEERRERPDDDQAEAPRG